MRLSVTEAADIKGDKMKSQNTQYPVSSQYDSDNVAVPINIVSTTRTNSMTDEIEAVYEYDMVLLKSSSPKQMMIDAIQAYLDTEAQAHFYDGILSLCSYATSTNTKFGPEGQAGVVWRDACWATGYAIMAAVEAQTRTIPTIEELLAEMPAMVWP
jgi:hypothetical protein